MPRAEPLQGKIYYMEHVVDLHNVEVRRDNNPILKDVTWTVNAGENWVILGPNGACESTYRSGIPFHFARF